MRIEERSKQHYKRYMHISPHSISIFDVNYVLQLHLCVFVLFVSFMFETYYSLDCNYIILRVIMLNMMFISFLHLPLTSARMTPIRPPWPSLNPYPLYFALCPPYQFIAIADRAGCIQTHLIIERELLL